MPVDYHEPLDDGDVPISSHYVPDVGFVGVQGSPNISTDGSSKRSSPVNLNLKQVGDVVIAIGQQLKAASIPVTLPSDQIVGIQQADLSTSGTLSAAQPVIGTPVTNATVQLAVGQGQSTWKALLSDAGGGFTSGSTIVADKSVDNAVTWTSASFKVTGASPATTQSSVVGPGPLELTGIAAGVTHVRIRCSVRGGTESIAVVLRASAGVADVGLMSSIPAGQNLIGYVEDIEQQGYTALTSPPSTTNAGSDTALTFSSQVNRVVLENHTSANVYYAFDTTASAGSLKLVPGSTIVYPKKCTVLHLFTAAAQNINGTADGNIVVLGAL